MIDADCTLIHDNAIFILRDLDTRYHAAALDLGFALSGKDFTRTFPAATPHIDRICHNFRHAAEALVLQTARVQPVPWQAALSRWLERVRDYPIKWFLGGSVALAVRGMPVAPRDFDIITDDAGAYALGVLFADVLIEPVVAVRGWMCNWFGRAFLDARFEWVGGVDARADTPEVSDFGPIAAQRLEAVVWHGHPIQLPPLDRQLAVSQRRGLMARVATIEQYQTPGG